MPICCNTSSTKDIMIVWFIYSSQSLMVRRRRHSAHRNGIHQGQYVRMTSRCNFARHERLCDSTNSSCSLMFWVRFRMWLRGDSPKLNPRSIQYRRYPTVLRDWLCYLRTRSNLYPVSSHQEPITRKEYERTFSRNYQNYLRSTCEKPAVSRQLGLWQRSEGFLHFHVRNNNRPYYRG